MGTAADQIPLLAGIFGGWEITLALAVALILYGARNLRDLSEGISKGLFNFKKATKDVEDEITDERASGVVYEALTPDNRTAEFVFRAATPGLQRSFYLLIAQGFGVGRIALAPGTFGAIAGLLWFVMLLSLENFWFYLAGMLGGIAAAARICGVAQKILKQRDPVSVVLDKIVSVPICFLPWLTQSLLSTGKTLPVEFFFNETGLLKTVMVLVLFRAFGIAKPWPVSEGRRVPGGWGMVLDDVLAAVCVTAVVTLFFVVRI